MNKLEKSLILITNRKFSCKKIIIPNQSITTGHRGSFANIGSRFLRVSRIYSDEFYFIWDTKHEKAVMVNQIRENFIGMQCAKIKKKFMQA